MMRFDPGLRPDRLRRHAKYFPMYRNWPAAFARIVVAADPSTLDSFAIMSLTSFAPRAPQVSAVARSDGARSDKSLGRGQLGLLGGMGSEAAAHFLRVLAQRTPARVDQQHVPFLLLSCPAIPDRSDAIMSGDLGVRDQILLNLTALEQAGCAAVAIPCNTAHHWRTYFSAHLSVPFIDIVEATVEQLVALRRRRVAILGTRATIECRLYAEPLAGRGILTLDMPAQLTACVEGIITLVKAGQPAPAALALRDVLKQLHALDPDAIVLGCTELSMIAPPPGPLPLVDPDSCLADACITWWRERGVATAPN
ncbi:aspartate/glutamate racemase family protein [Burkholderia gladioli]|uniref:aspartate/glutamate racemase family protein n=1 Tax=Burkholderia gladioli TaxID=28095 RepID=UPI00163E6FEB|nr:amino acid racemase [Burkholderia gladioli]